MNYPPLKATISTAKGDISLDLFADQAPLTVLNFVSLSKRGYYDVLTFHRVIADFMIQGGCPMGDGRGVIFQVLSPTLFHVNSPRRASLPSVFSTSLSS